MHKCIYKKTEFHSSTGEHILQNSFGPRWTSENIVCNEVQEIFGKTIDNVIAQKFHVLRNFIGAKSGRGGDVPKLAKIENNKGHKYDVMPGMEAVLVEPLVEFVDTEPGVKELRIKLGGPNQIDWAISIVKKIKPNDLNIDYEKLRENLKKQKPESSYISNPLWFSIEFGGEDFFRAILKSVFNLLGESNKKIALLDEFDPVRYFILDGSGTFNDFSRWIAVEDPIDAPELGQFSHFICIFNRGKQVEAYTRFYGEIAFSFLLAINYQGEDFQYSYLVDPIRNNDPAEIRQADFDKEKIPKFVDSVELTSKKAQDAVVKMMNRFMEKLSSWQQKLFVSDLVERFFPSTEKIVTDDHIRQFEDEFEKYISSRIESMKKFERF